jgi:hypothetical protein
MRAGLTENLGRLWQVGKLLLSLASNAVPGFGLCQDHWQYFCSWFRVPQTIVTPCTPLLGNGSVAGHWPGAWQRLSKQMPVATQTRKIEKLLDVAFSMRPMSYRWKIGDGFFQELLLLICNANAQPWQMRHFLICRRLQIWREYMCKVCMVRYAQHLPLMLIKLWERPTRQTDYSCLYSQSQSQSQSHITTDGRSVCPSWCRAPSEAHDQILVTVWQLLSCPLGGALSDERVGLSCVWVCHQ